MKSVSTSLLEGFGISPRYSPSTSEAVVIGLIATLSKHTLLDEAVKEVEDNTSLSFSGNLPTISQVATTDMIPYVHRSDTAVSLLLQITPFLSTMGKYIFVPTGVKGNSAHDRRVLTRGINIINELSKNIKVYLPHGTSEEVGVIKYEDKQDLLKTIQELRLPASIADSLAW